MGVSLEGVLGEHVDLKDGLTAAGVFLDAHAHVGAQHGELAHIHPGAQARGHVQVVQGILLTGVPHPSHVDEGHELEVHVVLEHLPLPDVDPELLLDPGHVVAAQALLW